jgi:hypothetical protein
MKKIPTLIGRELKWSQPRVLKMEFELCVGDELAATMRFPSSFRSEARGESADGCWTFRRFGAFCYRVAISTCSSDAEIASFKSNRMHSGGVLTLSDGRVFHVRGNIWGSRYTFTHASDEPVLELKNCGVLHRAATVNISPMAARLPELPMMVLLGWYLDVMAQNDAAVVTTLTATG